MGKTAIIIGAGPAGLTAAYELLKKGDITPIIIERENFVGGISRTVNYKGNRIDIGGHRFFTKSSEVEKLWLELMPIQGKPALDDLKLNRQDHCHSGGPDPENEDNVFLIRRRISRILYGRKFFDYPVSINMTTISNMGAIKTLHSGFSYIKSQMLKRDEVTLEDFMINHFGKKLYSMFFEDYTYKVWGKHPRDISADWGAQRIKGLSLTKAVLHQIRKFLPGSNNGKDVETSLIERYLYPKLGPGQYWETMASSIVANGGQILYDTNVNGFEVIDKKISSVIAERNGQSQIIQGDVYISSMPLAELIPALNVPEDDPVYITATNLPYRDFITVGFLVKKLKLENRTSIPTVGNVIPDCWIYIQDADVKVGRVQVFNNWSPYMVKDYENTVWIGLEYFCNENDELWSMQEENFIEMALVEAEKISLFDRSDLLDSIQIKVQKAYPAYFGTYQEIDSVSTFLSDYTNLYCIGRNGQHRYNNMDHSMLTAMEAVSQLYSNRHDTSILWNINAEAQYHESKDVK